MILLMDVAKDLKISDATLRQYISRGYVKATKIGRQWFVSNEEYERVKNIYGKYGRYKQPKQPVASSND